VQCKLQVLALPCLPWVKTPVLAADGSRHAISIRGKNIVATRTTDNILPLAVLLKAGYKVEFRVGTDLDPTDGGDLYTPKGKRIALVFSGNLWRLPMWSSSSRCESTAGIPAHQNPFAALLNIPENVACTRAASQPSEVSPLEMSVADQILKETEGRAGTLRFTQRSSNTLYCRVNVRVNDEKRRDSCSSSLINFVLNLSKLFLVNRRMSSS
jgi:hypothetical protein